MKLSPGRKALIALGAGLLCLVTGERFLGLVGLLYAASQTYVMILRNYKEEVRSLIEELRRG